MWELVNYGGNMVEELAYALLRDGYDQDDIKIELNSAVSRAVTRLKRESSIRGEETEA